VSWLMAANLTPRGILCHAIGKSDVGFGTRTVSVWERQRFGRAGIPGRGPREQLAAIERQLSDFYPLLQGNSYDHRHFQVI
jgi:hypothetical protein